MESGHQIIQKTIALNYTLEGREGNGKKREIYLAHQ